MKNIMEILYLGGPLFSSLLVASSAKFVDLDRIWCRREQLHAAATRMRDLLFWLLVRLPGVDFQNSAVARDG